MGVTQLNCRNYQLSTAVDRAKLKKRHQQKTVEHEKFNKIQDKRNFVA